MKKPTLIAAVAVVLAGLLTGCPIHDPVPCQGEPYPAPCVARDAGLG